MQRGSRLRVESEQEAARFTVEVSGAGSYVVIRQPRSEPRADGNDENAERSNSTESGNERVTLQGRLGSDPRFRTTARRHDLVASFPLGVHPDTETTVWHSVVVFGERARRLQDRQLQKGQEVEVIGYVHEREGRTRTGEPKLIRHVYATAVRTSLRKPPGSLASQA
jgi:hypothetical protein